MTNATEHVLSDLTNVELFSSAGRALHGSDYVTVSDWPEAVTACKARRSSGVAIEAANQLREAILAVSKDRFRLWNKTVIAIRPKAARLAKKKALKYLKEHNLPQLVLDHLRWDILHWCMEQEYADIVQPGFYSQLGDLYLQGRFPCGWKGDFPKGRLIVY